ncbi:hypothetical protein H2200_000556 [Cladophialophora chaetospira]|uniref:Extracellular serine-rich protein n=1 Tax=Cladophialophora chaetospira TaxID=386627 RepID=A0AA38XPH2_9EURO|nr:hypothetical protein H2200_000556 [Cladophialophora chaetospira]
MRSYALLSLGALATIARSATFDVDAGEHGFSYVPDTVKAAVGDTINVHFYPGDHSATQSTFGSPCSPIANGINSGFVNSDSGQASQMFSFKVNNTDPIYMYCGQVGHCAAGMAFVVNPPATGDTLEAYQKAASGKSGSAPSAVNGGVLIANVDNDDDNSSSSSSASGSATATATGSSTGSAAAASTTAASSGSGGAYGGSSGSSAASNFGLVPMMLLAPLAAYFFS